MVVETLKLGIAILNGGNSVVQQVTVFNSYIFYLCMHIENVNILLLEVFRR